jgi:hypothetical protein
LLTQRLGLKPTPGFAGAVVDAEMAALIVVKYLGFRGKHIDLNACATGLYSLELGAIFAEEFAAHVAQLLNKSVSVRAPRGTLYFETATGAPLVFSEILGRVLQGVEVFLETDPPK